MENKTNFRGQVWLYIWWLDWYARKPRRQQGWHRSDEVPQIHCWSWTKYPGPWDRKGLNSRRIFLKARSIPCYEWSILKWIDNFQYMTHFNGKSLLGMAQGYEENLRSFRVESDLSLTPHLTQSQRYVPSFQEVWVFYQISMRENTHRSSSAAAAQNMVSK